jgi:hypothetical protein
MKQYNVGFQNSMSTSYDATKTFLAGLMAQKTLPAPYNGNTVIGSPLSKFIDVQTDTAPVAAVLPGMMYYTANNRLFILASALATGVLNAILCYNFDKATGASSYVGKILFSVASPATPTARGFKVDDSNTSNIKIFIGFTDTTATTGGVMMLNKVSLANFTSIGTTYYTAQANDVPGVYLLQSPYEVGGANLQTAVSGMSLPGTWSANSAINTKLYSHNGVSATHQFYVFDYSTAPQLTAMGVGTGSCTSGAATWTFSTNHGLAVNDTVIITANAPTAFTVSTATSAQTIYYVIATGLTATQFQLSATLGGAALSPTSTIATTTFARALGQSNNLFVAKTANLPTLGAGTLLLTNSENACVPQSGALNGQDCVHMATTTNFLLGKISELYTVQTGTLNATTTVTGLTTSALTVGMSVMGTGIGSGTTIATIVNSTTVTMNIPATGSGSQSLTFGASLWPSLTPVNVLGTGIDYVLPTPLNCVYDFVVDKVMYLVAGSIVMMKNFVNSALFGNFGSTGNAYMEAQNHITDTSNLAAVNSFEAKAGWSFLSSSATTGQRGIIAVNHRADDLFNYSYIVSPVLATPGAQTLVDISSVEQMFDFTSACNFYYKTAATSGASIFSDPTTGWTYIETSKILNIALSNFTQFRIAPSMISNTTVAYLSVTTPAQVVDLQFATALLAEISDMWDYSQNDSSSAIPTRVGFVLRTAYATGTVPKLHFKAYDTSGVQIVAADTVANAGNFEYSSDAGVTWHSLGTIPNVVGTRIRYTFTTPPGVDVRVGLME